MGSATIHPPRPATTIDRHSRTRGLAISDQFDAQTRKAYYLEHFRSNRAAILEASRLGFDALIKGCPGWDAAALTGHMGRVYTFWLKWVRERPRGFSREAYDELLADREARLPGYNAWEAAGFPKDARPNGIEAFARNAGDELESVLVELQPDETVWTFVPPHQDGAFVFRRLAMETTVHRWDAEAAQGMAGSLDAVLARDGVDEMLMMFEKDPGYDGNRVNRGGQKVLLSEAGGLRRWLVSFDQGGITTSEEESPANVTVRGTAEDLWLFIMGRRSSAEMQIDGDAGLAASWGDLAGRF